MSDIELAGRVAVVTGAGGGLGRSHALALAARGARVVVNDIGVALDGSGGSSSPAQNVAAEIRDRGGDAVAHHGSVATATGASDLVDAALETWGAVDIVVNNAGFIRDRSITKLTNDDWDAVVDVHLKGAFLVSRAAFPHMKQRGHGRFVHTTSAAGLFGNFGQANYAAAKMGVVGLSRTLAIEGARAGISSNVVSPVAVTPRIRELGLLDVDRLGPLGDLLLPEQVTSLVLLLAADGCPATGEVYSVIGGRYARVFTAVTPGWFAGIAAVPQPEELLAHLDEVRSERGYVVPAAAFEEMAAVLPLLQGGSS